MLKNTYVVFLIFVQCVLAQTNGERYLNEVFDKYDLLSDIQYGQSVTANGTLKKLLLDIYSPTGDSVPKRPLMIFIHGGGFKNGDKVTKFGTRFCVSLAKRGYVVSSINYRLSNKSQLTDSTKYFEALYRAVQDGKAAVRFFRKNANLYGIDTEQIFVSGSSAGSMTALHMAYLDQDEIPGFVDVNKLGPIEGTSGNSSYSSIVQAVVNCWGALWDWKYIEKGDVPIYSIHGKDDNSVPCDSSRSKRGLRFGSTIITQRAKELGIEAGITLFENTGHTLDNDPSKQLRAIRDLSKWLYSILDQDKLQSFNNFDRGFRSYNFFSVKEYPNPINIEKITHLEKL